MNAVTQPWVVKASELFDAGCVIVSTLVLCCELVTDDSRCHHHPLMNAVTQPWVVKASECDVTSVLKPYRV
ncbi:hypothetical protein J6590_007784 [Homalodisca vitripennis]|nr:hypothetical protein J6590_007784 [Homalodisca vitripennis]